MRMYGSVLMVLLCSVAMAPRAGAQTSHAATPSAIDAALQQHVAASDADRQAVLQLLEREEIRAVAGSAGVNLKTAVDAVATMNAADLAQVAAQARQVEQALAGGQSRITISTTLLIIGLLLLIVLILALK
jgi:hypothetical protein